MSAHIVFRDKRKRKISWGRDHEKEISDDSVVLKNVSRSVEASRAPLGGLSGTVDTLI